MTTKTMDETTMNHLKRVLDHYSRDESRHYEDAGGHDFTHIWHDLFALRQWVGGEYTRNPDAARYVDWDIKPLPQAIVDKINDMLR